MVKRRKVLFGIGALAAGGAAATATGAFSAAEMNRDANINVVADDQGLIALSPDNTSGHSSGDTVLLNDNGELEIDFSGLNGDAGINVNSRYIVGSFHHNHLGSGPNQVDNDHVLDVNDNSAGNGGTVHSTTMGAWGYAFRVVNQSTENRDIKLTFEADESQVDGYLGFGLEEGGGINNNKGSIEIEGNNVVDSAEITGVPPGVEVFVSFVVSTINVDDYSTEDLSGSLTVSAE